MPNWCDNEVTITHNDKDVINGIVDAIKQDQGLFMHILPINEDDEDECYEKWGTKWDAQRVQIVKIADFYVDLTFETAWCPPVNLYDHMVENGYEIYAKYAEPGCDFCGLFADGGCEDYRLDDELPGALMDYVTTLGLHKDSEDED